MSRSRTWIAPALVFLLAGLAAPAWADSGDPSAANGAEDHPLEKAFWTVRASAAFRWFAGSTRVRENATNPDTLNFRRELGLKEAVGFHGEVFHENDLLRFGLEFEFFHPAGRGKVGHDFYYDEGAFQGGIGYNADGQFVYVRLEAAFKVLSSDDAASWAGPLIGLEYTTIGLGIEQKPIADTSESYRQFIPYPVIGIQGRWTITKDLDLDGRIYGTWVERWGTGFHEKGQQFMTARTFTAQALLSWRVAGALRINVGGQFQYFDGALNSKEDGNDLFFMSPAVLLGLELRL